MEERGAGRGMYGYEIGIIQGALGDFDLAFEYLSTRMFRGACGSWGDALDVHHRPDGER